MIQTDKMFMQSQQAGDMVAHPILTAADFPKEISPPGKRLKLEGKLASIEADIFSRMFELQEASVVRDFGRHLFNSSIDPIPLFERVKMLF